MIKFHKYQGTGNDFIMINNMNGLVDLSVDQIKFLCHRKLGVGADGVILLEKDTAEDFYVNYYNSDGSQSFCGNGSRCSVSFAFQQNIITKNTCRFMAIDGLHSGEILENSQVKVSMGDVDEIEELDGDFVLNTGSPHYVKMCTGISEIDLLSEAHKIRYNHRFSEEGINVNFVEHIGKEIHMRTYERGVEDETLSCGTGVTAVALSLSKGEGAQECELITKGGTLRVVSYRKSSGFNEIFLIGNTEEVFEGKLSI